MNGMSFSETIFLFFLALVIFGPKKLPEIARQVGKVLNEFRRASNEFKSQIEHEIAHLEVEEKKQTILPPSEAPAGTANRTLISGSSSGTGSGTSSETADASPSQPTASESAPGDAPTEPAATLAANEENAGAVHATEPATEALAPEAVTSATSQESHA